MKVRPTPQLSEVLVIEPDVFGDDRGFFMESWNAQRYAEAGVDVTFVQDNISRSSHGVLRGLHLQHPHGQGKLVSVLEGEVFDVCVDVRHGSPTFGRWAGQVLSAKEKTQMWIPPGFAHGFCVTSPTALFCYKCSELYHPQAELSVLWNDPQVGIAWPLEKPLLSAKDADARASADIPAQELPRFEAPEHGSR